MNSLLLSLFVCLNFFVATASASSDQYADPSVTSQTTTAPKRSTKSPRKASADAVHLTPPQVLEEGDVDVGLRASQGGIYNGSPVMALSLERMVKPNFGLGAIIGYSHFSSELAAGPMTAEMDSTIWAAALVGSFHTDIFKVKNLDTFLSVGFGHAFISTQLSSNAGDFSPSVDADGAANFFIAYLNARYFIDSSWGFTASLGTGLGTLSMGVDYLF